MDRVRDTRRYAVFLADKGRCAYCHRPFAVGDCFTIDHVLPRSIGGTGDWSNLVLSCRGCNEVKGGRRVDEAFGEKVAEQVWGWLRERPDPALLVSLARGFCRRPRANKVRMKAAIELLMER